jgi:hypothetical protein
VIGNNQMRDDAEAMIAIRDVSSQGIAHMIGTGVNSDSLGSVEDWSEVVCDHIGFMTVH